MTTAFRDAIACRGGNDARRDNLDRGRSVTDPEQDEVEPSQLVAGELERLARHPRGEAHRLHDVADAGESGSAPFIEIAAVAFRVVPIVLLMIGIMLGIYFAFR